MKNKTLTVTHTKGGVGKSTILVNFAIFLCDLGFNVRVADCDPNRVTTMISKIRGKNQKLKNFTVTPVESIARLQQFCLIPFDGYTLIDTAGVDNALTRRAIELGDVCVVPVAPSITEVIGFRTFEAITKKLDVSASNIKVILNQTHPRATKFDDFKKQLGGEFEFFNSALPRLGDFVHSLSSGHGVVEMKSKKDKTQTCNAGVRFSSLAVEMMEVLSD